MRARRFLFTFALMLAFGLPALAQQWVEVRSPNLTVVTDSGQGRDIAMRFEQMRSVFAAIFHRSNVNIPIPLTVVGFRNTSEFKASGSTLGKPLEGAGFYQPGEDRNHIVLDLSAEEKWPAGLHEYAHVLLNSNYPRTQPWFDEGFAEYFAATRIVGNEAELGQSPPSATVLSRTTALKPVVQLFGVAQDAQTDDQRGEARQLFYAQSWLVVHWIFDNHRMGELGKYFNLVMNRKVPVAEAFKQAFSMDPTEFDKEISDYWHAGRFSVSRVPLPSAMDPNNYTSRKLTEPQAKAVLAELHAHLPDRQKQAIEEFKQVLAVDPDNQVAQRGLGFAYLREHDVDAAAEHIHRAVALNDQDARAHYYNAVFLNHGSQTSIEATNRATQMSFELQKAIQIDPAYADAYNLLSIAQLSMDRTEAALGSAKKAVELGPRNEHFMFNLSQVQAMLGDTDSAQAILRVLQNSADPAISAQAIHGLSMVSQMAKQQKRLAEQKLIYTDPTDPRWKPKDNKPIEDTKVEKVEEKPDLRKIQFLKGTLVGVNCAAAPAATLMVSSGGKTWNMKASDKAKVVLIGAEQFSCDWKNVKVAVNYKSSGALEGDLVSLEVQ